MQKPEFIAQQAAHAHGLLGRIVAAVMAKETASENTRALELLDLQPDDRFLDVGTGHGESLKQAARWISSGQILGLDVSQTMVRAARRRNRSLINCGLVHVERAGSRDLPLKDEQFDKVLSVHTIYFWTSLVEPLKEIARVMAADGTFVLCFRPGEDPVFKSKFPESVYTFRSKEEVLSALEDAGLHVVNLEKRHQQGKGNIVWVVARKRDKS